MGDSGPGPRGKVGRLLEQYDLDDFGDYLVEQWTREEDRQSLRALARELNIKLLKTKLMDENVDPISGTAESYYESLTDDAVSSGVRTRVQRGLEKAGIDVVELEDDFVSRQAIHTYLTKNRDVNQSNSGSSISVTAVQSTIDRLSARMRDVTNSRLERLQAADKLSIGEFRVIVDVQVFCSTCGTQQSLGDLLSSRGCECDD